MVNKVFIPDRGDLVWLSFDPQAGHEQSGRRPALTLSPKNYNSAGGLALFCPITSRTKGYPFEVELSPNPKITGYILADQVRSLDWRARQAKFVSKLSEQKLGEVMGKLQTLLK